MDDIKVTLSGRPPEEPTGAAPAPIDPATGMHRDYWILPQSEIDKGYVRPLRMSYIHEGCGKTTTMNIAIAETYARNPKFYGRTFCAHCNNHQPIGEDGVFTWPDGSKVGT